MKTNFIIKNFVAVAAVAIALGTMSFKLAGEKQTNNWYAVNSDGSTINSTGLSANPTACTEDSGTPCALQITVKPGQPFPLTVSDAHDMQDEEKLTIHNETFKP